MGTNLVLIEPDRASAFKVVRAAIPHYQAPDGKPYLENLAGQIARHTANGFMPPVEKTVDLSFLK